MSAAGSWHRFRVERPEPRKSPSPEDSTTATATAAAPATPTEDETHGSPPVPRVSCRRCRRTKKRCSRELPVCQSCRRAGVSCSYTQALPSASASARAVADLQARVAWLSAHVNSTLPAGALGVESLVTGSDIQASHADAESSAEDINGTYNDMTTEGCPSPPEPSHLVCLSILSSEPRPALYIARVENLPAGMCLLDLIRGYFDHIHRSYPFLDKTKVLTEAEPIAASLESANIEVTLPSLKTYLLMAIGCEYLWRSGTVSDTFFAQFRVPYDQVTRLCLGKPSVETVEVLLLVTMHSLFDPDGWSPWTLVGIVARHAISIGLNLKTQPQPGGAGLIEMEFRYRLFWSIFSLDRLVSVSYGLPFAIEGGEKDVPLPGITMDEFGAPEQAEYITTLQIARQFISLRELEGRCLAQVHLHAGAHLVGDMTHLFQQLDHHQLVRQLRTKADNWFTEASLLTRAEPHHVPIHNTIPWLNVNYHSMLMVLYSPSRLNSHPSEAELSELQSVVIKYVRSAYTQFQQRHLPLGRWALNKLLVTLRTLLYCCCQCEMSVVALNAWQDVAMQCAGILDGFPSSWTLSSRASGLSSRLAALLHRHRMQLELSPTTVSMATPGSEYGEILGDGHLSGQAASRTVSSRVRESHRPGIRGIEVDGMIQESEVLLREALGPFSAYHSLTSQSN